MKFEYFITDSIIKHKCILKIRHTVEYEFQNLYLFISSESNKDTIEVLMAEKNGRWVGKGIGNIREVEIILNTNKIYNNKGEQKIIIEQAMRHGSRNKIETLKHIDALGIIIAKEQ